MDRFTIVLGNKAYSSWSLRGWLVLAQARAQAGIAFDEIVIPLRQADSRARILEHSSSGRVPALRVEGDSGAVTICDSLAIAEYLAERFPAAGLWPQGREARALARSAAAEMHAGFTALRERLPMDLRRRHSGPPREDGHWGEEVAADIARICALWRACRATAADSGDFLFGGFGAADAAFAPVVIRFLIYGVALDPVCAAYREAVLAWPAMREWIAAAEAEPWTISF